MREITMKLNAEKLELIAKRDELQTRLDKILADIGRGLDPDSSERAVQLENAEVLDEIARVTDEELKTVELAIAACDQ